MNQQPETPRVMFIGAFIFEVLAAILLISPLGSCLSGSRWVAGPSGALLMLAAVAAWPWIVRLLPGPKPWRIFFRRGTSGAFKSTYYGFLAAVLIITYRFVLSVGLWAWGIPVESVVTGSETDTGLIGFARVVILSVAVGVFFFGYVQGFAERLFGGRAGTLLTGVVFAFCAGLPLAEYGTGPGGVPRWTVFLVLHLPIGVALAYMRRRTRSWVAPVTAAFFIAASIGVGKGILYSLGWAPFFFAMVVTILIAAEIVVGERTRLVRFYGGFVTEFFTSKGQEDEPVSLLDGVLLTVVSVALLFFIRAVDFFFYEWYITLPIGLAVFFVAEMLWLVGRITTKESAVAYEAIETKDITPPPPEKPATPASLPATTGNEDIKQVPPDAGDTGDEPEEKDISE
jgi:membrane protease YdiL (CAAX protease family)